MSETPSAENDAPCKHCGQPTGKESTMSNDTQTMTLTEFLLARIAEDEADRVTRFREGRLPTPRELREADRWQAECEAKRRIVELHGGDFDAECHEDGYGLPRPDDCPILRALAAIWSDHPDYRQEWRP